MTDAVDGDGEGSYRIRLQRVDPLNAEGPFGYAIQWWLSELTTQKIHYICIYDRNIDASLRVG